MKRLKIFVSSPGDVAEERALAGRVIDRLGREYADRVELEPIFWEHEPLLASSTFQDQIVRPSETDIVLCILWSRLGTRLPPQFARADGTRYASGTEFEFEDAVAGHRRMGSPDLLVYKKTAEPLVSLRDSNALLEKLKQREALDAFIERWFHDEEDGTLRGAFHDFEEPEVFEETLERHLRKLILRHAPQADAHPPATMPAVARWTQGSPFRGLEAFDVEHADVFFGRTRAVSAVLEHLREQDHDGRPFVLVLGMSGGGKSSLARAGVLPLLTTPGVVEGVVEWRIATMKPSEEGLDPFLALATALLRGLPELSESGAAGTETAQALREAIVHDDGESIAGRISDTLASLGDSSPADEGAASSDRKLVLLIDQLEELFTISTLSAAERAAFGRTVAHLVESGVWTLATMRSDLYPRLQEAPELFALKEGAGQYDLLPPSASDISQMIRQPALAAGLRLERDPVTGETLEDRLRDAAVGRPGSLPLLEFTLEELHRLRREDGTLTFEAFEELGGVEGSLARRAEGVWEQLPDSVRGALTDVMRQLVTVAEGPDGSALAARRAELRRLHVTPESTALVDALVEARLLTTDLGDGGDAVVRIAHEALLRHWPRLKEWIEQDRETLKARGRLRGAAFRWAEEGRRDDLLLAPGKPLVDARAVAESGVSLSQLERDFLDGSEQGARRLVRLRRLAVAAMVVLSLAAGGSALAAWSQAGRAETEAYSSSRIYDFIFGLVELASPRVSRGETVTVRDLLAQGGEELLGGELEDTPLVRAKAARDLAQAQLEVGGVDSVTAGGAGYRRALELAQLAAEIESTQDAVADTVRAETWIVLGNVHSQMASYDSAAHHLQRAVDLVSGRFPRLEELALVGLSRVRYQEGDVQGSFELTEQATTVGLTTFEPGSEDYAGTLTNLGQSLLRVGRFEEAETALRQADSIFQKLDVLQSQGYTTMLDALATTLQEQGRYSAADSVLQLALSIERRITPDGHESVGSALNNLALNAQWLGDTLRSERHLRESLDVLKAAVGDDHQTTAQVKNNLAELILQTRERPDEAFGLFIESIETLRALAPQSSHLTAALINYSAALQMADSVDRAVAVLEEATEVHLAAGRVSDAAQSRLRQGVYEWTRDDTASAEGYFERAIEVAQQIEDPTMAGRRLAEIQDMTWTMGSNAIALRAARLSLEARRALPDDHPELARAYADLAWWHAIEDRPDSADAFIAEAILILDRASAVGEQWIGASGSVRAALSQRDRTVEMIERQRRVIEKLRADSGAPEWIVQAQLELVEDLVFVDRYDAAFEVLDQARELADRSFNEAHPLMRQLSEYERAVRELSEESYRPGP